MVIASDLILNVYSKNIIKYIQEPIKYKKNGPFILNKNTILNYYYKQSYKKLFYKLLIIKFNNKLI